MRKFNLPEPIFWTVAADKNKAIEFFVDRIRSRDKADGSDEKDPQPNRQSSKVRHSLVSVLPISTACTEDKDLLDLEFMAKSKPDNSRKRYSLGLPNPFSAGLSSERRPAPKNNQVLQQLNNSSQQIFIN